MFRPSFTVHLTTTFKALCMTSLIVCKFALDYDDNIVSIAKCVKAQVISYCQEPVDNQVPQ